MLKPKTRPRPGWKYTFPLKLLFSLSTKVLSVACKKADFIIKLQGCNRDMIRAHGRKVWYWKQPRLWNSFTLHPLTLHRDPNIDSPSVICLSCLISHMRTPLFILLFIVTHQHNNLLCSLQIYCYFPHIILPVPHLRECTLFIQKRQQPKWLGQEQIL